MYRLAVVFVTLLIGAAAPSRAWCEATCVAPASTETHCPTHEPVSSETAIGATAIDNCPALEDARPATSARVELKAALLTTDSPQFAASRAPLVRIAVTAPATTAFQRHTPLRI